MYFLCKGRIAVFLDPIEAVAISELEEGDFFGEDSFFQQTTRNATCVAITYCDCLDLAYEAFKHVLKEVKKRTIPLHSTTYKCAGISTCLWPLNLLSS